MQLSEHPFGHVCLDSMLMLLLNGAVLPKAHEDPLLQLTPYPRQTELAHASEGVFSVVHSDYSITDSRVLNRIDRLL